MSGRPSRYSRIVASLAGRATGNQSLRIFTAVGLHPRLFRWWLPFAGVLLFRGRLPRRDAELLILRTAWNSGSSYEWVQHAPMARAAGLDPRRAVGVDNVGRDRLLTDLADELCLGQIESSTAHRVSQELSAAQGIEACFVVGHYRTLASVVALTGIQPEPSALDQLSQEELELLERLRSRVTGPTSSR